MKPAKISLSDKTISVFDEADRSWIKRPLADLTEDEMQKMTPLQRAIARGLAVVRMETPTDQA